MKPKEIYIRKGDIKYLRQIEKAERDKKNAFLRLLERHSFLDLIINRAVRRKYKLAKKHTFYKLNIGYDLFSEDKFVDILIGDGVRDLIIYLDLEQSKYIVEKLNFILAIRKRFIGNNKEVQYVEDDEEV